MPYTLKRLALTAAFLALTLGSANVSASPLSFAPGSTDETVVKQLTAKNDTISALTAQAAALQSQVNLLQGIPPKPLMPANAVSDDKNVATDSPTFDKATLHKLFESKDSQIADLRAKIADLTGVRDILSRNVASPATLPSPTAVADIQPPVTVPPRNIPIFHYATTLEMTLSPGVSFSPWDLATDSNGNLYVGGNKLGIRVYNNGVYQYSIGYPDPADARRAVEANGVPVETDENSIIQRADPIFRANDPRGGDFVLIDGKYSMLTEGHLWLPAGISVNGNTVAVMDNFTETAQVFIGGVCQYCIKLPPPPGGRDSSGRFTGIVLASSKYIFVTDAANNCLIRASSVPSDGADIFGNKGTGNSELNGPISMTFNRSTQEIYICDRSHSRVVVFNTSGQYLRSFGTKGTGAGQFTNMYGIAVDKRGRIYVGDKTRIEVFSILGQYLTQFGVVPDNVATKTGFSRLDNVFSIAVDDNGLVYASDPMSYNIKVYTQN